MLAICPSLVAESSRASVACRFSAASAKSRVPAAAVVEMTSTFSVCLLANAVRRLIIARKSSRLFRTFSAVVESKTAPTRSVSSAMSPAIRPACAVSCPMSGSVAPGQSAGPARLAAISSATTVGSSSGSSREMILASHSPKRLAVEAMTAGAGGNLGAFLELRVGQDPVVVGQLDGSAPCPTLTPRRVTGAPTPRPPTVRKRTVTFSGAAAELAAAEPEGGGHGEREGDQERRPDDERVAPLHTPPVAKAVAPRASWMSGRPSMNCRTTGSSVC